MSLEEGSLCANENSEKSEVPGNFNISLSAFSHEELVAMNQILVAIPQARDFQNVIDIIYTTLKELSIVYACACYLMLENGLGLRLVSAIGECKPFLPDIIPQYSDLFIALGGRDFSGKTAMHPVQPSLFGDDPIPIICPIGHNNNIHGALALMHGSLNNKFLCTLLGEAASILELMCNKSNYLPKISQLIKQQDSDNENDLLEECEVGQSHNKLTAREKEVLHLLTEGLGTKEIAERLFISSSTCKHHIGNILTKLHVHNRTAAVVIGLTRLGNDLR